MFFIEPKDHIPGSAEPALSAPEESSCVSSPEQKPKKKRRIGRIVLLSLISAIILLLLTGWILYLFSDYKAFKDLRKAYVKRIDGEDGFRVTQVEEFEDFYYFTVEVTVEAESDPMGEPFVVSSATAICFREEESAEKSYEGYQNNPLETCMREGKILIFWRSDDPFQDLYQEVFHKEFER